MLDFATNENFLYFIFGTALAIPLAIIANFATVRISKWLEKRRREKQERNFDYLKKELEEVTHLYENRDDMYIHMTITFLKVSVLSAIGGAFSSLFNAFGFILNEFYIFGSIIPLFTGLLVISIALAALNRANKIKDYESYKSFIENELTSRKSQTEQPRDMTENS